MYPFQVEPPPAVDLGLVVAIPCYAEPDLETTLESLWRCARPRRACEVLVVVNGSEADDPAVIQRNRQTVAEARAWASDHADPRLVFHVLEHLALPPREHGVGLARKLGMDEAAARLAAAERAAGIIVSLDADCTVDPDYLTAIEEHFDADPGCPAASLYFEHPLAPGTEGDAIARYELHLRYYVQGLRYAGSPYAFHTVGSCLAVRSGAYLRQGGMNRRRAGEDFHLVQKLIPLGGFSEINQTTVRPAARVSRRVPFGTGRAMATGAGAEQTTYDPAIFADLKVLFARIDRFREPGCGDPLAGLAPVLREFLDRQGHAAAVAEIRANTATWQSFRKRWFRWFNGFRAMKYANFASRDGYPRVPVEAAARLLLEALGDQAAAPDLSALLAGYRRLDRTR